MHPLLFYFIVVGIYAIVVYEANNFLVDKKRIKRFQDEFKKLNEEFKKAYKKKDTAEMERLTALQAEKAKEMPFLLKEQLKMTAISLILFFGALAITDHFDPAKADDVNLLSLANFNTSHTFTAENEGLHILHFKVKKDGHEYKGELVYAVGDVSSPQRDAVKSAFNESSFYIKLNGSAFREGSPIKLLSNATTFEELIDDNGTRAELWLSLFGLNFWIHGIWLFVAFSLVLGLIYGAIRPKISPENKKAEEN